MRRQVEVWVGRGVHLPRTVQGSVDGGNVVDPQHVCHADSSVQMVHLTREDPERVGSSDDSETILLGRTTLWRVGWCTRGVPIRLRCSILACQACVHAALHRGATGVLREKNWGVAVRACTVQPGGQIARVLTGDAGKVDVEVRAPDAEVGATRVGLIESVGHNASVSQDGAKCKTDAVYEEER